LAQAPGLPTGGCGQPGANPFWLFDSVQMLDESDENLLKYLGRPFLIQTGSAWDAKDQPFIAPDQCFPGCSITPAAGLN
jgi:hypothetical protein